VADITYIRLRAEFIYLAVILDGDGNLAKYCADLRFRGGVYCCRATNVSTSSFTVHLACFRGCTPEKRMPKGIAPVPVSRVPFRVDSWRRTTGSFFSCACSAAGKAAPGVRAKV
jgi:hypothetical protein